MDGEVVHDGAVDYRHIYVHMVLITCCIEPCIVINSSLIFWYFTWHTHQHVVSTGRHIPQTLPDYLTNYSTGSSGHRHILMTYWARWWRCPIVKGSESPPNEGLPSFIFLPWKPRDSPHSYSSFVSLYTMTCVQMLWAMVIMNDNWGVEFPISVLAL